MNINDLIPDSLEFGSGPLYEVSYLQQTFGISRRTAFKYLKSLHIEALYIGKKAYYSHITFNRIMFVLSKPNSPGFIFPGSTKKNDSRMGKGNNYLTEVTKEILEQAADPAILAEMDASTGKNPNLMKQFIARPVGRPRKDENK
jgi:hypothetical protein